ncbi:MAG: transcription antitermination factor NusB [Clostridia bacterium]|nr:transcription antitermination factor NusB [Clostridia bacterium]
MTRTEAREAAFILLFEQNFKDDPIEETLSLAHEARELKISGFGKGLFSGAMEKLSEIDALLESALINWRSERISKVARTAMRLCIYEFAFTDIQGEIAINEALELIKKYDCPESAAFANGVLGTVYATVKSDS